MPATLHTAALHGTDALPVEVQVDLSLGLPGFFVVGLPDSACMEARVRCQTALRNQGFELPQKRVTVNLAPADLRKEGASFDLPIALCLLQAAGFLPRPSTQGALVAGELSLSGEVLPVRGVLPMALRARELGLSRLVVPAANAAEGALVRGLSVLGVRSLREAAQALADPAYLPPLPPTPAPAAPTSSGDLSDVAGQASCKRALELAAAGGHNLLLIGPPGSGKTMLARRMPGILPPLEFEEALEATAVWSVAGRLGRGQALLAERPFRAPHHTISVAGLVGGGSPPRPGEISLAHRGVLFLDELPEFQRTALEALRQPLEDGEVMIARARSSARLPASFVLLAAMNPCPCGHTGTLKICRCPQAARDAYRRRVSGPILDRFDLHMEAPPLAPRELGGAGSGETSAQVRARVVAARERQAARLGRAAGLRCNAQLKGKALRELCAASPEARAGLVQAMERLELSARAHDRILKVARTIADLEGAARIEAPHLSEALQYRCFDRPLRAPGPELPPLSHLRREAGRNA